MEFLKYFLFLTLPATGIVLVVYLILNKYFSHIKETELINLKKQVKKEVTPLKIQAYERLLLYSHRISPESLSINNVNPGLNNKQLFDTMNQVIKSELDHNLTQQLYVSDLAWKAIIKNQTEVLQLINVAFSKVDHQKPSIELATTIIEIYDQLENSPTYVSNQIIRNEFNKEF